MSHQQRCTICGYTTTATTPAHAQHAMRRHSCERHLAKAAHRNQMVRARTQRPTRDCTCKIARHQHGTRAAYVIDRCRCQPCTAANAKAAKLRQLDTRPAYIDTAPAVTHLQALQAAGLGWKRIAHLAGVPESSVYPLLYGRPDRDGGAPRTKARAATVTGILAVPLPTLDDYPAGAVVPAHGVRRRLQALATQGWSLTAVAAHAGLSDRQPLDHAMHAPTTSAATARAVRDTYNQLWDQTPVAGDRWQASAIARVRNHAARQRWAPPMAWDDDTIDLPSRYVDYAARRRTQRDDKETAA